MSVAGPPVAGVFGRPSPETSDVLAKERRRSRRGRYPKSTGTARRRPNRRPNESQGGSSLIIPTFPRYAGRAGPETSLEANPSHKLRLNFTYSIRAGFIRPDS